MELYELAEDAMVRSAAGEALGEIERFVIDPSRRQVSHVVVKEGFIFKERRVVPVEMIDHVGDEGPVLTSNIEVEDLDLFESEHYVPVDELTRGRVDEGLGEASIWRYPTIATGWYPAYPGMGIPYRDVPEATTVRDVNVPEGSAVVTESTPIESMSGEHVGRVAEVVIAEDGRLSHLVVDFDDLDGSRLVPAHWVDTLEADRIVLAVGDSALERLVEATS